MLLNETIYLTLFSNGSYQNQPFQFDTHFMINYEQAFLNTLLSCSQID
jgi:hypothetical protein